MATIIITSFNLEIACLKEYRETQACNEEGNVFQRAIVWGENDWWALVRATGLYNVEGLEVKDMGCLSSWASGSIHLKCCRLNSSLSLDF